MRVIITGGTGLIGRQLAIDLVGAGHEVIVLSRAAGRAADLPEGVRVTQWDTRSAAGWGGLADGAGAIVNLAGENLSSGRWTTARKEEILQSRLDAGRAVVEAIRAAQSKPLAVIQASAVGYYGPRGEEWLTEASAPGKDYLSNVTVQWEQSTAPVEEMGVRRAVIRSGVVLSPKGGALAPLLLVFRLFAGGPVGSGRQRFPWIHIGDEVAAIRFLIENANASGPFNLSAPNPPTNAEFSRALGRALGRPSWLPVPAFALRLLFGEMATVLLDGQRVTSQKLQQAGFRFRFTEAEPALRDLLAN